MDSGAVTERALRLKEIVRALNKEGLTGDEIVTLVVASEIAEAIDRNTEALNKNAAWLDHIDTALRK